MSVALSAFLGAVIGALAAAAASLASAKLTRERLVAVLDERMSQLARDVAARDQAWYWTPAWQEGEREADEDLAAGRYDDYDSGDEFLAALADRAKAGVHA